MPSTTQETHEFTDPIHPDAHVVLVVAETMDATGVRHPDCELLAHVSPDLDAFYCSACSWNGRISGAWFMDLWRARGATSEMVPKPQLHMPPVIVDIGDDGQYLVGYGHVDKRLFRCLAITHYAQLAGIDVAIEYLGDDDEDLRQIDVAHLWAIERLDDDTQELMLRWGGVGAATPGAFPITMIDMEE